MFFLERRGEDVSLFPSFLYISVDIIFVLIGAFKMQGRKEYSTFESEKLYAEANRHLVGGVNSPVRSFNAVGGTPLFISKGEGSYIFDEDGNKYIDFVGSWGPLILGHSDPDVIGAVSSVLSKGLSYGAPCKQEIEIAKLVVEAIPSAQKVRMTNSGTEATMSAVRLARGYTSRDYIVKFEGCYHGHADHFLVSAGSGATTFGSPSSPGVPHDFVKYTLLACYNDISSVEEIFNNYGDGIAAVIVEPIAGNMGVVVPEKEFLLGLREITRRYGALLIFDEVITGFRVSKGGAQELYGVYPDITCLGKIIGGGMPVGAYCASSQIMGYISPEGPVYQAGTLSGNPVAMTAGVATLNKIFKKEFVYDQLEEYTAELVEGIRDIISKTGVEAVVNRVGSMFTIFFTKNRVLDYRTALKSDTSKFSAFFRGLLEKGVLFPPSQFETAFVSIAHGRKEMEKTLEAMYQVMKSI